MNWKSTEVSGLGQERFLSQAGQGKRHQRGRTTWKSEDGVALRSLSRAWRKFGNSSCAISSAETHGCVELSGRKLEIHINLEELLESPDAGTQVMSLTAKSPRKGCSQVRLHKTPLLGACQEDSGERFRDAFEKDGCRSDEGEGSGPGQGNKTRPQA